MMFAPLAQAAGFAAGCLVLHTAQRHAGRVTPYLVLVAAMLLSLVLAVLTLQRTCLGDPLSAGISAESAM
jgi:hypothetical protein